MSDFDVFNGDADGICALVQLRNAQPREAILVTGVKRDIALLARVPAKTQDRVVVLDVSLDKNREGLNTILEAGAEVFYVDHHFAGEIPQHENLQTSINTAPDVCTSMLINDHLNGAYVGWAIVGAFGDNLKLSATNLAKSLNLGTDALTKYERLGVLLNYNGYGASVKDLHFAPDELYRRLVLHATPDEFLIADSQTFSQLDQGYDQDMANARSAELVYERDHAAVVMLPDESWARRVSGVFGNDLANLHPERAHAVITQRAEMGYLVSVRAPLNNKTGADDICRQFPTGGGRKAAAGVNDLPLDQLDLFIKIFQEFYLGK